MASAGQSWRRAAPVIVFYMALKHLPTIVERLVDGGRDPLDSAAVVASAATAHQRVVTAPLRELPDAVRAAGLTPPAIVVVGKTVEFREHLDWWTPVPAALRTAPEADDTAAGGGCGISSTL